jgi:fatty acid desaturase
MDLRPKSSYVQDLRPHLPADAFEPARSRLLLVPINLAVIATAVVLFTRGAIPLWLAPVVSLVLGVSFSSLTFLAHETLHGSVVRGSLLRHVVGWIGFSPFVVSPRLWIAWHNQAHHANAQVDERDPDVFPSLHEYRTSRSARFATDAFAIGGGRWRGGLSLILGFTVQSAGILFDARRRGLLAGAPLYLAFAETALAIAVWVTVLALVGPLAFIFAYVIPLLIANVAVMSFILTNHALSPRTSINDPLVNSLSVTVPGWMDRLSLGFGYHVEHHIFPAMSSRRGPMLRRMILERWPERYQSMPLSRALLALHRTARVYRDNTTLLDPSTGRTYPTLGADNRA